MTKTIIVSDIHVKLRRYAGWEANRFTLLIDHIIAQKPDNVILNGDLFDYARPTLEEQGLVLRELFRLSANVKGDIWLLDGNHEAVTKSSSTYDYITIPQVRMIGEANVEYDGVTLCMCGWSNLDILPNTKADVLVSHFRSDLPPFITEEVDTSAFEQNFKLQILGDLHYRYSPKPNVHYTNSPYSVSNVQVAKDHGYIELVTDEGKYTWRYIDTDLPNKIKLQLAADKFSRYTFNDKDLFTVEVTGTLDELRNIEQPAPNVLIRKIANTVVTDKSDDEKEESLPFIPKLSKIVIENNNFKKREQNKVEKLLRDCYEEE